MKHYKLIANVLYARLYVFVPAWQTVVLFCGFRPLYVFSDLSVVKPVAGISGEDFPSCWKALSVAMSLSVRIVF